jgi:ribosomal protein L34E
MKPKKRKSPSLKQVAKTYKKTHTKPDTAHSGSHFWDGGGMTSSRGNSSSKLTYKPKPMQQTLGGTRKGKGVTIKKKGKI